MKRIFKYYNHLKRDMFILFFFLKKEKCIFLRIRKIILHILYRTTFQNYIF